MQATWYGRGTWYLDTDETTFLTDPYFDSNITEYGPEAVEPPDYVLVSHAHWTRHHHLDSFPESTVIANTELVNYLTREYDQLQTQYMNAGGTLECGDSFVTMHVAEHSHGHATTPPDTESAYARPTYVANETNVGLAAGYIISEARPSLLGDGENASFYYTGETQLMTEMRDFVGEYIQPTAVATPVASGWTMGPFQAAIATEWLDPKLILPVGDDDQIRQFRQELAATESTARVSRPTVGEPITFG